jgi:hypothetical protein
MSLKSNLGFKLLPYLEVILIRMFMTEGIVFLTHVVTLGYEHRLNSHFLTRSTRSSIPFTCKGQEQIIL